MEADKQDESGEGYSPVSIQIDTAGDRGLGKTEKVSHRFMCYHVGQNIELYGDFNQWSGQTMELAINQRTGNKLHQLTVSNLKPG